MAPLSVHLSEKLEVSVRKAPFVLQGLTSLCLVHQATIAKRISWTRNQESALLVITAMGVPSSVTQSTKQQVIGVQRVITAQLKVPTQLHAYQEPMLTQNSTSSRTIVNHVYLVCFVLHMDLTIQAEIVQKDSIVLLEKHNRVRPTRSVSLATFVLNEVGSITHVLLERINRILEKNFATLVQLEAIVIPMKQGKTCPVWEMILVE